MSAVHVVQNSHLSFPSQVVEKPPICDVVTTVALQVLKELAVSLALGAIVACFVATPSGLIFMMSASIIQLVTSVFFHSLGAYAAYKALDKNENHSLYEKTAAFCQWAIGGNFSIFTGFNSQIVIHESGHALASLL